MDSLEQIARAQAIALASLAATADGYRVPRLLHGVVKWYSPDSGADVTIEGSDVIVYELPVAAGYAGGQDPQPGDVVAIHALQFSHRLVDKIGQL